MQHPRLAEVAKPSPVVLNELCQRQGWRVEYTDLMPQAHLANIWMLETGAAKAHPFYKTRRCKLHERNMFDGGCPRGDACPSAHSEEELRPQPTDLAPEAFMYSLRLVRSRRGEHEDEDVHFENVTPAEHKGEAKAAVARQCLDFIHQFCQDVGAGESDASLTNREAKTLIWICKTVSARPAVKAAARHSYERWLSCLGSAACAKHPELALRVRNRYGSFSKFIAEHAKHFPGMTQTKTSPETKKPITSDEDVIEFLTSNSKNSADFYAHYESAEFWSTHNFFTSPLLRTILGYVQEAGPSGVNTKVLKERLQNSFDLPRSIKTFRLAKYVEHFPSLFLPVDGGTIICQQMDSQMDFASTSEFPPLSQTFLSGGGSDGSEFDGRNANQKGKLDPGEVKERQVILHQASALTGPSRPLPIEA